MEERVYPPLPDLLEGCALGGDVERAGVVAEAAPAAAAAAAAPARRPTTRTPSRSRPACSLAREAPTKTLVEFWKGALNRELPFRVYSLNLPGTSFFFVEPSYVSSIFG
jgi:hypothetical protein